MAAKTEEFSEAMESFAGDMDNGVPVVVNQGRVLRADDPIVKKWPQFFQTLSSRPVEQATAAPGEKRQA